MAAPKAPLTDGLHLDEKKGTATLVMTVDNKTSHYTLRQVELHEYADITDWVLEAVDQYKAEVEVAEDKARMVAYAVQLNQANMTTDSQSVLLELAASAPEISQLTEAQERRTQKTYRPDSPCLLAMLKIVALLNTNKNAPEIDANRVAPYLTQPEALQKLHVNLRLPLVHGTTGSPNGIAEMASLSV